MTHLCLKDIEFNSASVVDPAGKVFHYDGRIFRAITKEYADMYRHFLAQDWVADIFAAGLIGTWVTDLTLEGFDLVLEHKKVPELSFWSEWCSDMAKDAAITYCNLNIELAKHNYITKDTSPANMQFIDGNCYWIDFGSIVPIESHGSFRFEKFRFQTIVPMWLWSKGYRDLADSMYQEPSTGYLTRMARHNIFRRLPLRYHLIRRKAQKGKGYDLVSVLEELLRYLNDLDVSSNVYPTKHSNGKLAAHNSVATNYRSSILSSLLEKLPPGLVLDLASNGGMYAEIAVSQGNRVVTFDRNETAVCSLYQRIKSSNTPVLPLVVSLLEPTQPYGYSLGHPSSYERFKADTVLAIDIIHHLIINKHVYFEPLIEIIAKYSRKIAIIEFATREDPLVNQHLTEKYCWYSLNNFIQAAKRYFKEIEVKEFFPSSRKLLVCHK